MFVFAGNRWQRHTRTQSLFQHSPRRRFSCQLFHGRRNSSQVNRNLIRYHRPLHRDSFSARQRYEQRDAQHRTPRKPQLHGRDRESEKSDSCVREHLVLPAGSSIGFGWIPSIISRFFPVEAYFFGKFGSAFTSRICSVCRRVCPDRNSTHWYASMAPIAGTGWS